MSRWTLPFHLHLVLPEMRIGRQDQEVVRERLTDEEAVEGILVVQRKGFEEERG